MTEANVTVSSIAAKVFARHAAADNFLGQEGLDQLKLKGMSLPELITRSCHATIKTTEMFSVLTTRSQLIELSGIHEYIMLVEWFKANNITIPHELLQHL